MINNVRMLERFQACVLLHAVGDSMGYKNGKWEFQFSSVQIHDEVKQLGGIDALKLTPSKFRVSDDTVLHLAVSECLVETNKLKFEPCSPDVYLNLVNHYKIGMQDMKDRAPGNTTMTNVSKLTRNKPNGYLRPFDQKGGGCGASMRSSCIGLRFSKPNQIENLIAFAIESSRMTHHHPIGYLGGVSAALMTSYAIQDLPVKTWGKKCLDDFELARNYIKQSDWFPRENLETWDTFINPWKRYLKTRNIENGNTEPIFPDKYGVEERHDFYKTISGLNNWAGGLGLDSVIIAYDGILGCKGNWKELCLRAMLHGGDNDSTGCIAGSFYGALYGFIGVSPNNYEEMEYKDRLLKAGKDLYELQYGSCLE